MSDSADRRHVRRQLEAHLIELGYSASRVIPGGTFTPEVRRVSPVRGRVAYGQTVLRSDLTRPECHERLLFFSQRRTRHRSSILFFIGVAQEDEQALIALLRDLGIQSTTRGGHVHIVSVPAAAAAPTKPEAPQKSATQKAAGKKVVAKKTAAKAPKSK